MKIDEVCLLTNDVRRLADFYKRLLETENNSNDETHQFILTEGSALTVYNDGSAKNNHNQNVSLAFTVEDMDKEYQKLRSLGVRIIEESKRRPWGAVNMSFYDPDNNMTFFRCFSQNDESPAR